MATALLISDNANLLDGWQRALLGLGIAADHVAPAEASRMLKAARPRLCLYDLGERRAADTAPVLALMREHPGTAFLAMTAVPDVAEGAALLQGGAKGYCNRLVSKRVFPLVVETVRAGEMWVGALLGQHLLQRGVDVEPVDGDVLSALTPKEQEIARLVGSGRSNKVIAADLGITERTVKAHLSAIFRKTGLSNRVQLALSVSAEQEQHSSLAHA